MNQNWNLYLLTVPYWMTLSKLYRGQRSEVGVGEWKTNKVKVKISFICLMESHQSFYFSNQDILYKFKKIFLLIHTSKCFQSVHKFVFILRTVHRTSITHHKDIHINCLQGKPSLRVISEKTTTEYLWSLAKKGRRGRKFDQ